MQGKNEPGYFLAEAEKGQVPIFFRAHCSIYRFISTENLFNFQMGGKAHHSIFVKKQKYDKSLHS